MESPYTEIQMINQELLRCHLKSLYGLTDGKPPQGLKVKERDIPVAPIEDIIKDIDKLRTALRK